MFWNLMEDVLVLSCRLHEKADRWFIKVAQCDRLSKPVYVVSFIIYLLLKVLIWIIHIPAWLINAVNYIINYDGTLEDLHMSEEERRDYEYYLLHNDPNNKD